MESRSAVGESDVSGQVSWRPRTGLGLGLSRLDARRLFGIPVPLLGRTLVLGWLGQQGAPLQGWPVGLAQTHSAGLVPRGILPAEVRPGLVGRHCGYRSRWR